MRQKIETKISEIVDSIIAKPADAVTKDEYDILASELRRAIYDEETKEKNKKLAEAMGSMIGSGFGSY